MYTFMYVRVRMYLYKDNLFFFFLSFLGKPSVILILPDTSAPATRHGRLVATVDVLQFVLVAGLPKGA